MVKNLVTLSLAIASSDKFSNSVWETSQTSFKDKTDFYSILEIQYFYANQNSVTSAQTFFITKTGQLHVRSTVRYSRKYLYTVHCTAGLWSIFDCFYQSLKSLGKVFPSLGRKISMFTEGYYQYHAMFRQAKECNM